MDPTIKIDERIEVVAIYRRGVDKKALCVPWKMIYHGRDIVFTILALRHETMPGQRMVHIFSVSDGANDYTLEFDAEALTWNLKDMTPGHYDRRH